MINNIEERKISWRYIIKTCKLHLPVVRTLEITKIIDFNPADYSNTRVIMFVVIILCPYVCQFRLVNYFDLEIVRSVSAYFGKTRSEIGYCVRKFVSKETFVNIRTLVKRCPALVSFSVAFDTVTIKTKAIE